MATMEEATTTMDETTTRKRKLTTAGGGDDGDNDYVEKKKKSLICSLLTPDVVGHVLSFLDPHAWFNLNVTCRGFHQNTMSYMNNPAKKAERERNLNYMIVLKNPPQSRNPFVHLDKYVEGFKKIARRFETNGADEYRKLEVLKIHGLAKLLGEGHAEALKFIKFTILSSLPYAHTDPKRFEMYYKTILNVDSLIVHSSRSYGEVEEEEEDPPAFRLADTVIGMDLWWPCNFFGVLQRMRDEWTDPTLEKFPFILDDKMDETLFIQMQSEIYGIPVLREPEPRFSRFFYFNLQLGMGNYWPKFFFAEAYKGKNDDVEALGEVISSSIDIVHGCMQVCSLALPRLKDVPEKRNQYARTISRILTNEQINAALDRIQSLHPTDQPIDTGNYVIDTHLKMILKRFD
jgi:hypothetical protein